MHFCGIYFSSFQAEDTVSENMNPKYKYSSPHPIQLLQLVSINKIQLHDKTGALTLCRFGMQLVAENFHCIIVIIPLADQRYNWNMQCKYLVLKLQYSTKNTQNESNVVAEVFLDSNTDTVMKPTT